MTFNEKEIGKKVSDRMLMEEYSKFIRMTREDYTRRIDSIRDPLTLEACRQAMYSIRCMSIYKKINKKLDPMIGLIIEKKVWKKFAKRM